MNEILDIVLINVEAGGSLAGILFPIIEAFFPVLPLVAFVIINVSTFGFFLGYLYSWIGNCIGSFLLFLLIRKVGGKRFEEKINQSKYKNILEKIKMRNMALMFFLYCFPFTPSFLISGTAALANMNSNHFLMVLLPSKFVMMLSLAFIGENISSFFENPAKSLLYIIIILFVNFIAQKIFNSFCDSGDGP